MGADFIIPHHPKHKLAELCPSQTPGFMGNIPLTVCMPAAAAHPLPERMGKQKKTSRPIKMGNASMHR